MITKFENYMKLYEDGDGGCAMATNASSGGMGNVVAPTVSAIPGDVAGSIAGSGDIANGKPLGPFTKLPLNKKKRKKKA